MENYYRNFNNHVVRPFKVANISEVKTSHYIVAILLFSLFCAPPALNAEVETSIGEFLRINPSAASSALGGAGVSQSGSADYGFLNPASPKLEKSGTSRINTSYTGWLSGTKLMDVFFAHSSNGEAVYGGGLSFFVSGEMEKFDKAGKLVGDFRTNDFLGSSFYNRNLTDKLRLGASAKIVSIDNDGKSNTAFAADIGCIYSLSAYLSAGLSLANLGLGVNVGDDRYELPRLARMGMRWELRNNLTALADITYPRDDNLNLGLELSVRENIKLRCGWDKKADLKSGAGLTAGLGFAIVSSDSMEELRRGSSFPVLLLFDYAFQNFGELGYIHRINFGIQF